MQQLCAFVLVLAALTAQTVPGKRSLADVQRAFAAQRDKLYEGSSAPTREQELELLLRQADELAAFVEHEAEGDDRWNGRLALADLRLSLRQKPQALTALRGIDAKAAPGLLLLSAAAIAVQLGDNGLRTQLLEQALQQPASLEDRLMMARVLMTLLREIERGEKIFTDALAAAADDEARAYIRWLRCESLREREDLPDNTFFDELDKLAKDLPSTRYGSIAKDRSRASQFQIGAPAIDFTATTTSDAAIDSKQLRGKAVLLVFWSALDPHSKQLVDHLQQLGKQHGDDLVVLGIGLDADRDAFLAASKKLGVTFAQICDGNGPHTDVALRYGAEVVPTIIAVDRSGRIAGLNLQTDHKAAQEELELAVQRALQKNG